MEVNLSHGHAGENGKGIAGGPTLGEAATLGVPDGGGDAAAPQLGGPPEGVIDGDENEAAGAIDSTLHSTPSITMPPYWQNMPSRQRAASTHSSDSGRPTGAILLLDNEADDDEARNNACWAKSVEIIDHTVVNGGATSIGAFVVWNVRVETLQGSYMNIRKRYSEFDALRHRLMQSFPNFDAAVPSLPPKSVISKFRPKFLEKRRAGLQYFLNCIILNPEFSGSPVLKDFLFS
ncbi:sorting nexin [Cordyceps militaris]|uniref:Endosomal/vacuolar adapter protein YPT35 n=1 Tax=Cordyceps militaris TaxID=73501 RepID=A0A2H4SHI3_CORMI|nr:sorting nexin [Cordyceps militaris]